jgi:hypothetical protein
VPLFRRKNETRLHQIGEAEAYGRSYGEVRRDVKIVKVEPRRPRYQRKVTGEALRSAFLDRLNKRDPADRPDVPEE